MNRDEYRSPDPAAAPALRDALVRHLEEYGHRYGPCGAEGVRRIQAVKEEIRPASHLHWFDVHTDRSSLNLVVKVPVRPTGSSVRTAPNSRVQDRPRIVAFAAPHLKPALEFDGLRRIHEHFCRLGDDRFGTVRAYGLTGPAPALVMEAVGQPSLRGLLIRSGRWPSRRVSRRLNDVFQNAGAWLRQYHTMPALDPAARLMQTREDFLRFQHQLIGYLAKEAGHEAFFGHLLTHLESLTPYALPNTLPSGLAHGGFATRHILVGPGARVTVLDTTARYVAPFYRDIGMFLANVSCGTVAAVGRAAWVHPLRVQGFRRSFLHGYFWPSVIPVEAIRLFEVQALLERWCSTWEHSLRRDEKDRLRDRVTLSTSSMFFRALIQATSKNGRPV
jgi:hypothetical protein